MKTLLQLKIDLDNAFALYLKARAKMNTHIFSGEDYQHYLDAKSVWEYAHNTYYDLLSLSSENELG